MWFKKLTGFAEESSECVRENIVIHRNTLTSKVNGKTYQYGVLEIPTLESLRLQLKEHETHIGKLAVKQIVGDVRKLHCDEENRNALFQAASQFNLLEMVGPHIRPEDGIDIYEKDFTQGPACAIACGAGTLYRNYFASVNGQIGQSKDYQIDCLDALGKALKNEGQLLWKMENGYAFPSQEGLLNINKQLFGLSNDEYENLKGNLKVGIQWETEVTIAAKDQLVSQVYCSALPVAYSTIDFFYWEKFARLILEGTYEATLYAGLLNYERTGSGKVFLTMVGGGAFGNQVDWIMESMCKALLKFKNAPLEISIVSYGARDPRIDLMLKELNR